MKHFGRFLSVMSLVFSAGMLVFTFCTFAWYSDVKGFEWGFEIPISTESGLLMTLADAVWMAAPFFLVVSLFLFGIGDGGKRIGLILSSLPLCLYAILRALAFLDGKESHATLFITLSGMVLLGAFTVTAAFVPEVERIAARMAFSYAGIEVLLLLLSMLFQEKYSFFYFSQLLPMGHTSHFRYSFFAISPFLYYLFYALSLGCRLLIKKEEEKGEIPLPPTGEEEKKESEEEEEEDLSSLSLEDLGISR